MRALSVIEGLNVIEDGRASLLAGDEPGAINQFELQSAPEAFHDGIIVAIAFTAHRGDQTSLGQGLTVIVGGILNAAVRVKDQMRWWLTSEQSHLESFQDELGIQEGAHIPADDFAAIEVQNGRQEKPAFPGFNVSDIRHPDLVDFRGFGRLRQKIGSNGMVMVAVGGAEPVTALLPTVKVVRSHESSDTVAAMLEAALAQLIDDARAAIGFAALEVDGFNLLSQSLVFFELVYRV